MSIVEKALELAVVVVVGIAKFVWAIVGATRQYTDEELEELRNRKSFSELVDEACARVEERRRISDTAFADSMLSRALNGDPIARYHPAYRSREEG
jgi:hypothetical protein